MSTIFLRLLLDTDKTSALLKAIREDSAVAGTRFEVDTSTFSLIPRSPFAYWVRESVRDAFRTQPRLASSGRIAASGGKTLDDFRWIRAYWETEPQLTARWVGFAKGGAFSPYYADIHLMLDWRDDARALKAYLVDYRSSRGWSPNWTAELHGSDHYLRPGLTWPRRTNGLSFRVMPAGCVFGDKGPAVFEPDNDQMKLLALAAIANSKAFGHLMSLQVSRTELAQSFEVGLVQQTPVPRLDDDTQARLAQLAHDAWLIKRETDSCVENSHAFSLPALLQATGTNLNARVNSYLDWQKLSNERIFDIQSEIDDRCFLCYGFDEVDPSITLELPENVVTEGSETRPFDDEDDLVEACGPAVVLSMDLASWVLGVAFGRFDIRLANGARQLPCAPAPFDALPLCSPGMLADPVGLPARVAPAGYPISLAGAGWIVDEPGHPNDICEHLQIIFEQIFDGDAESWLNDVATHLNPSGNDIRAWFADQFFDSHLRRYTKSKRKAPIYWQLAIPSGRYSVWLYAMRVTSDIFFRILHDAVMPKLTLEEQAHASLVRDAQGSPGGDREELENQESFVAELRQMADEIRLVAPLWNPNLDDGVVLVMAPLWRLVPQHKSWQKELRTKWQELSAGKYDWAHLAMHLWPERVVPKCAADRSLAIAHGLEYVFWLEGENGAWTPRKATERAVEDLITERTSPAVKEALKNLLEAPEPVAIKRSRKARGR